METRLVQLLCKLCGASFHTVCLADTLQRLGSTGVELRSFLGPLSYSHNSPDKYMPRVTKDPQALHTSDAKLENHLEMASNHQLCLLGRGNPKITFLSRPRWISEDTSCDLWKNCVRRLNMAELSRFPRTASQCGSLLFLRLSAHRCPGTMSPKTEVLLLHRALTKVTVETCWVKTKWEP